MHNHGLAGRLPKRGQCRHHTQPHWPTSAWANSIVWLSECFTPPYIHAMHTWSCALWLVLAFSQLDLFRETCSTIIPRPPKGVRLSRIFGPALIARSTKAVQFASCTEPRDHRITQWRPSYDWDLTLGWWMVQGRWLNMLYTWIAPSLLPRYWILTGCYLVLSSHMLKSSVNIDMRMEYELLLPKRVGVQKQTPKKDWRREWRYIALLTLIGVDMPCRWNFRAAQVALHGETHNMKPLMVFLSFATVKCTCWDFVPESRDRGQRDVSCRRIIFS